MKFIGGTILITTGFLIGYFFYEKYTIKINFFTQYIEFITFIKNSILCYSSPLKTILLGYKSKNPLKKYIEDCVLFLNESSFSRAWGKSFEKNQNSVNLSPEEKNLITGFGRQLGTSDSVSQAKYCEQQIEMIKPYLKKAVREKSEKGKLPIVLGAGIGIAVTILMV
ncbi:MAG: stage III sporulation protein AB [Clostridia bacterium]|nr:stage III sporulation protein AB [Clostridia bacterium]